jgi:ferric-dicitrate binding protein FerR (iron transport regulator)
LENYRYELPEDFLSDISFCNYCKGAPDKDVQYWTKWLASHPEAAHAFREAEQLYKLVGVYDEGYQRAFERFSNDLQTTAPAKRRWLNAPRTAAAAAVLIAVSLSSYYILRPAGNQPVAEAGRPLYDTIDAGTGQVRSIRLADSTAVTLNSHSRLLVPSDFNEHDRKVVLVQGEAFFDVTRNANKPFSVTSKGVETRVLGTSFNIQAYPQKTGMRITLLTGSVSVHTGAAPHPIQLRPDEQLTIGGDSTYAVQKVPGARYSKWISGELDFYEQSLEDIAATLSTRYGAAFVFADDPCRHELFTASFAKGEPLKKVLALLSTRRNIRFTQKGDTVTVNRK